MIQIKYWIILSIALLLVDWLKRNRVGGKEKIRKSIYKTKNWRIIQKLTPEHASKAYTDEKRLIQKARVNISVEGFQVVKLGTFLFALVFIFSATVAWHNMKINEILNKQSISINILGKENLSMNSDGYLNKLTQEAYKSIDYAELLKGGEYEELSRKINNLVSKGGLSEEYTVEYTKKVYKNILNIYNNRLKPIDIILILLVSLGSLVIPKTFLRIRGKRTEVIMETELNKLEILTILLLKKEDTNIYQILIKLKSKAEVFKPYLKKCVNNYQKDGRKAMEVMQKEVDFKPFTDFINILKQGIDTNKQTTANVLEMTRRLRNEIYQLMSREKNKKRNRNILIIRFPMVIVGVYLLILPWIIIFKENFDF